MADELEDVVVDEEEVLSNEVVEDAEEVEEGNEEDESVVPVSELQRRLNRAQKKHEDEIKQLKSENQREIKKARMSQAEKKAFEIEEREKTIEERELSLNKRELESNVKGKLASKGLPDTFVDTLVGLGDEELIDLKIDELKGHIDALVNNKVKDKISQPEPQVERKGNVTTKLTKADFNRLSYADKEKLLNSNPNLYDRLNKQ